MQTHPLTADIASSLHSIMSILRDFAMVKDLVTGDRGRGCGDERRLADELTWPRRRHGHGHGEGEWANLTRAVAVGKP